MTLSVAQRWHCSQIFIQGSSKAHGKGTLPSFEKNQRSCLYPLEHALPKPRQDDTTQTQARWHNWQRDKQGCKSHISLPRWALHSWKYKKELLTPSTSFSLAPPDRKSSDFDHSTPLGSCKFAAASFPTIITLLCTLTLAGLMVFSVF